MELKMILFLIALIIPLAIKEQREKPSLEDNRSTYSEPAHKPKRMGSIITTSEFINNKDRLIRSGYETSGVYIITNKSKGNYKYVGQSIDLIRRVNSHVNGRGNKDIYKDLSSGDEFTIELIKLIDTNYTNLNDLERILISENNSYYNGYNKTRGNK